MSAIDQKTLDLSTALTPLIKSSFDSNGAASLPKEYYLETLPEGVTPEIVTKLQEHHTTLFNATAHAFGSSSVEFLQANPNLDRTTLTLPMVGKDYAKFDMRKSQVNNGGPNGASGISYGVMQYQVNNYSNGNRGDFGRIKDEIRELAKKAFGPTE